MNNLLSAYFQRLLKSRLYWCLLGLMILSGIIIPILAHREMIAYGTDYTLESRLVWHFLIIGFIVAIFCSWFLGTDYSDGKGITPNINLCEQKIVRSVDKTALLRIFNNIIDNAIKYSEGDLTISLFENGKIVFSNHTSDLNEIQIGKLFDRFYTVNTARKSTGLGLSIAKALIEKMDGNISADYSNNVLSIIIKLNEV